MRNIIPIIQQTKSNDGVAAIFHALLLCLVARLAFWEQVMVSIHIDRRVVFSIEEIWPGMAILDQLLSVGRQAVVV